MATATKHSPTTPSSSSSVPGSPQSPNNNNSGNTVFHQIHHHHHNLGTSTTLSSPGHIASYEYSQRIHQGGGQNNSISRQSSSSSYVDGTQEEISSIAKQISDHAEAIYQTWKARGLAPTEILSCQLSTHADQLQQSPPPVSSLDPLNSPSSVSANPFQRRLAATSPLLSPPALSYAHHQTMPLSTASNGSGGVAASGGGATALNELLAQPPDMSNNNKLEKLVNSFVNEDKARIAAQRRSSQLSSGSSSGGDTSPQSPKPQLGSPTKKSNGLPSLSSVSVIKQTLQKFENQNNNNSPSAKNYNLIKPSPRGSLSPGSKFGGGSPLSPPINGNGRSEDRNNNEDEVSQQRSQLLKKNLLNSSSDQSKKNVPDVLLDTITSNNGSVHNNNINNKSPAKPQTPVKPPNLLNHVPAWPLKSRAGSPTVINGNSGGVVLVHEIHIERGGVDSPDAAATIVPKLRSDSGGGVSVGGSKLSPGGGGFLQNKMKSKTIKGSSNNGHNSDEVTSITGNQMSSEVSTAKRKGSAPSSSSATPAATNSATGLKKKAAAPVESLEDAVKREEECLINALKSGGQVLKSSALVSDSMLKMTPTSEQKKKREVVAMEPSNNNIISDSGNSQVQPNSDNGDNVEGEEEEEEEVDDDKENEEDEVPSGVNFELSTDVAGPPPSNSAHHVPKVWQNEDGVFEALTDASKPAITSKMFKTRPVRTSVLETMIHNEIFNDKVAKAKRDKEIGLNPCTPFLSRGSVAERVLIFERCPEIRAPPRMPQKLEPNKLVSYRIN